MSSFITRLEVVGSISRSIKIHHNNSFIVRFSYSTKSTSNSKYIGVRYLALHERIKDMVSMEHINKELIIIDPLIKGLIPRILMDYMDHMGYSSFYGIYWTLYIKSSH